MKGIIFAMALLLSLHSFSQRNSIHQFKAKTILGEDFDFASLKGKKVLVVNTASKCMLTPQFKKLQELYEMYGGENFEIVGFPCNDFGNQDPGTNKQILDFCFTKYDVSFLMMEKISIKGDNPHPIYKWLSNSNENGKIDAKITWNFQKFMINENGEVVDFVAPIRSPKNKRIVNWLKR